MILSSSSARSLLLTLPGSLATSMALCFFTCSLTNWLYMNAAPLKFGSTNQAMNSSFSSYQFGILNWQRDVPGINPIRYSDGQFCGQKIESSIWTFYLQMCMSETPNNCRRRSDQRSNFTSRWGTAAPSPWGWWMSKGSSRPATAHRRALTSSPSPALTHIWTHTEVLYKFQKPTALWKSVPTQK